MAKLITIDYEGKQYKWDGRRWYSADDYLIPNTAIIQILNKMRQVHQRPFYPQFQKEKTKIFIDKNEDNCTILTDFCVICNKLAPHGKGLCDGRVYHSECYTELSSLIESQHRKLAEISIRISEHKKTIKRATSWGYKIRSFFVGDSINISDQEHAITRYQAEEEQLGKVVEQNEQKIRMLWEYWLEYPPDWDERKRAARDDVGEVCERCGESERLQVHHRKPVAAGGSHCPDNLEVLCVYCHGETHGRDFTERKIQHTTLPSAYAQRLDILRCAMEHGLIVYFSYRKNDGERSTRSFRPQRFKRFSNSLCIEGWCYLRKDTRVFAIKRMSRIKIVPSN